MSQIKYIHAADLHLDTPFRGISRDPARAIPAKALREATFQALDNLIELCATVRPDFLALAGDIFDHAERGIKAQLRLRDACARLERMDIPVFITHGNHDPLSSRLASITWPDNTFVFGARPEKRALEKSGRTVAVIHGASHANDRETRNFAKLFQRDMEHDCFQLGILHCNVDNALPGDIYAPCSLADLKNTGLDAWALGHIHKRGILSECPLIAYSGSAQGLNPGEPGARGCFIVTAELIDGAWRCSPEFARLGPVQWEDVEIDLEKINAIDSLSGKILSALDDAAARLEDGQAAIITLHLKGHTELDRVLRGEDALADITEELRDYAERPGPLWLRKINLLTAPPSDDANAADRDDLLGEICRMGEKLQDSPAMLEEICSRAFQPLFGGRRLAGIMPFPDEQERQRLLAAARKICQETLEGR